MRSITSEELITVLEKHHGEPFCKVLDELLPGFGKFVDDPIFRELLTGQSEASAVLFAFAAHAGIDSALLVKLKEALKLMVAVGWFLHQVETERVPDGATIH
jgi:hypothetical protein